jgi:predicted N-acetyltransferase YhbS
MTIEHADMSARLAFRSGYLDDRESFLALTGLLKDTFDIDIALLDRFGGPDPSSMPFGLFDDDGRCVANFSAFSMPLVVDGKVIRAAGYQSGAVRPDYRGRGLYRDLMERAFAWSDAAGFEAGILLTDKPELYRRYGFESVSQHCFRGSMPAVTQAGEARALSLDDAADLALVTRLLEARADVSQLFAARRQTKSFLLNACFDPDIRLSHAAGPDAVVAWKQEGDTLSILDIVAMRMPALGDVLSALGTGADHVEVMFPVDQLGWQGEAVPFQGSCDLMIRVRGGNPAPLAPFMLAPMADF